MNVKLLHISDIHFGPPHLDELDAAVRLFLERVKPDALLVSGDITQRAKPEQFAAARAFLKSLSVPQVTVPGNHDVPLWALHERFTNPFERYRRHFSEDLEPTLKLPGAWVFGLNTAKKFTAKNGVFRAGGLGRCERFFADAPSGVLRVVVAHHHLLPAPGLLYDPVASRAREAAYSFSRARVDVVAAGHLHHAFVTNTKDFYSRLEHGARVVHSGTTMSNRGRAAEFEANSLNVITADETSLVIENFRYVGGDELFSAAARYSYPRAAAPVGRI